MQQCQLGRRAHRNREGLHRQNKSPASLLTREKHLIMTGKKTRSVDPIFRKAASAVISSLKGETELQSAKSFKSCFYFQHYIRRCSANYRCIDFTGSKSLISVKTSEDFHTCTCNKRILIVVHDMCMKIKANERLFG